MRKAVFLLCLIALLAGAGQSHSPPTAVSDAPPTVVAHAPTDTAVSPHVQPLPPAVEELSQAADTAPQTVIHQGVNALDALIGIVPQEDKPTSPTQSRTRGKPPNSPPKATVPRMGDTQIHNGEPQIWIEGFGWITDNGGGSIGTIAENMYENGNKIGVMGDDHTADSDGDINKMVGIMGGDIDNGNHSPPQEEPYVQLSDDLIIDLQTGESIVIKQKNRHTDCEEPINMVITRKIAREGVVKHEPSGYFTLQFSKSRLSMVLSSLLISESRQYRCSFTALPSCSTISMQISSQPRIMRTQLVNRRQGDKLAKQLAIQCLKGGQWR